MTSIIEQDNPKLVDLLTLLQQRPTEFARRLDSILRNSSNQSKITVLKSFESVAEDVSVNVLLQIFAHFKSRDTGKERVAFPKGSVSEAVVLEGEVTEIHRLFINKLLKTIHDALVSKFSSRESMGKVYIDNKLSNYLVPMTQRSASESLKTVTRGSKIDLPEGDVLRLFTWWKDQDREFHGHNSRVDIDLSAVMYSSDWKYIEHISYTNLKSSNYGAYHSGDITSAPNGASEFIDINMDEVEHYGGRYIVSSLYCYTDQPFSEIPEVSTGWMIRQNIRSGEIYEPATVQEKFSITQPMRISIPVIIDVVERKAIWCDLGLKHELYHSNNIENNQRGMVAIGKGITNMAKPNMKDLILFHVKGRGEIVSDPQEADYIFDLDKGITPFDTDYIVKELL